MWFRPAGLAALVALVAVHIPTAAAQDSNGDNAPPNHSVFVNSDGGVGFAFSVPDDNEDQFYFTLRVHRTHAWGAIGLGSDDMPGALHLMVYDNSDQTNVTFSPRISYGYYEPEYYPEFEHEILEGTGIYDNHMVVRGKCLRDCMTWPRRGTDGGRIDSNSTTERGIYALGPIEGFASNRVDESLKFHAQYGTFIMDMSRAHGATGPLSLDDTSRSDGARLDRKFVRRADVMSVTHAVTMVLSIVLLMPLGVVMLRLGGWVRWHALNQTIAMLLSLAGFGLGIATSLRYQRSRGFDSYHQVIGYFVISFVLIQFSLGVLHHRRYRETQTPTRFGQIHLWLGRLILLLGIMNGFFGFTFALNRRYGIILAGLVIGVCFMILLTVVGQRWLNRRRRRRLRLRNSQGLTNRRAQNQPSAEQGPGQMHGRAGDPGQDLRADDPPPRYWPPQQQQQNIGLRQVVYPFPSADTRTQGESSRRPGWEPPQAAQAPRELI